MKMRLIPVVYFGFTAMDRRFSSPMLPWIFSEIRKREHQEKVSLGVEDGCLQGYNQDFEVQFTHKLSHMTRFSQADSDPCTFLYLLRDDVEQLLYCYLYTTYKQSDVSELYQHMKEHQMTTPRPSPAISASNLTSLCVDISPSCSNFFEVLYIGKIKVWHKKVPDTFIDDALDKFRQHDQEKNKKKLARLKSEMDLRRGSVDSTCSLPEGIIVGVPRLQRSYSLLSNLGIKSPEVDRKIPTCIERITEDNDNEERAQRDDEEDKEKTPVPESNLEKEKEELRKLSIEAPINDDLEELEKQLKNTMESDEHNRTMVLQVDRTDLRLISPDRKVILLHKQHKDVATCIQGVANSEHFGFISREPTNTGTTPTYIGFVFKCESSSVASEAVAAITQAFNNPITHTESKQHGHRPSITSCDHCPMVWFHRLCCEIENMSERKQQAAIFRRIEQLEEDEQTLILAKYRGAETDSLREQNEFLMMLLRAHCEMKQGRHTHDTAEQRSEFLNQYLGGGGTIFMKAKRSLSNSFDHLLKRRGSKDDFAMAATQARELTLPVHSALIHNSRENSPSYVQHDTASVGSSGDVDSIRSRSSTMSSQDNKELLSVKDEKNLKSPIMDIFMKVGTNSTPIHGNNQLQDAGSWRQAIFKRVVAPAKPRLQGQKLTKEDTRQLWKKAIHQAILLVRMEKENARIRAKQEESAVKRIKLEYDEMLVKHGESLEVWDLITNTSNHRANKIDGKILLQAIKHGVPRGKRGDVWHYLAEQFCAQLPPIDAIKQPTYNTPYETLLKQLTSHQHAILIDLGRTFPSHSYFASPLGPGQLALFNLLKAYSLLDPEVGYCQGLSFVAGVLLLHMDEPSAFFLLRHLMYRRNLRLQYLPDMVGLQVKLYQLSRLLRDQLPEVYDHLDAYEVAPTLYAAPWLLTIFASQFPLGFVTRVFDLIFLENTDVIFRVILALLTHHKEAILACDSFEDIMTYLKTELPRIDKPQILDSIMKRVYSTDIAKQLTIYQVEYNVLHEEMQSIQNQLDAFSRAEIQLRILQEQNKTLSQQLDSALSNIQRLELAKTIQQSANNKLEANNRSMDVTIHTLGNFVHGLLDSNANINLSGDVRRILEKIPCERIVKESSPTSKNLFSNIFKNSSGQQPHSNRLMVKSLSTGRIALKEPPNDNVLRANSLNINGNRRNNAPGGGFFSDSHKDILQHLEPPGVVSPTNSIDSGVCTPITHKAIIDESEEDSLKDNDENLNECGPPLSHSEINVTYNTRELKKVKSIRDMSRNSSPVVE